jgi:hypothetical protein
MPILRSVDSVKAIGAIMDRDKVRFLMQAIIDGQHGINTFPTADADFEKFRELANQQLLETKII